MAKIEIRYEPEGDWPASVECLEVLVRGASAEPGQIFAIGSGENFGARSNFWLEVRYSVQDVPVFYTRNVLSCPGFQRPALEEALQKFTSGELDYFSLGDMLPETYISLHREKKTYPGRDGETRTSVRSTLNVGVDIGAVYGHASPGLRMMDIKLDFIKEEDGILFARTLIGEMDAAADGCHPDPASLPPGHSEWFFVRDLYRKAYDAVSSTYQEDYFANPVLADAFDRWLDQIPVSGHVLDAGCGHGHPVIARLLERGRRVIGSDVSPSMLARARQQFPSVEFWESSITEINVEGRFDGACSFSSLLYLDPVDFFHGIYRLSCALKPGGLLFLHADDLHPDWRGHPYRVDLNHWMWGQTYGMDEAAGALEEHGYFKVLETLDVTTELERQARIEHWRKTTQKQHEDFMKRFPTNPAIPAPDLSNPPHNLPYSYIVIAQKQERS